MRRTVCAISLTLLAIAALGADEPTFRPDIPKAWDDKALEGFELPMIPGIYFRGRWVVGVDGAGASCVALGTRPCRASFSASFRLW